MRCAETGVNLEIDLSHGSVEKEQTDPKLTELHLGGQGTAAKILWDRVPPEAKPFSADNILIFSTGLLHGTLVPGANRVAINTFSPQTNLQTNSLLEGYLGPEMKYSGYDKVIFSGQASDLVYIYINNDKVEIRDARHLQGKGTLETGTLIRQELDDNQVQVAAISMAGENRVYMASIDHGNASVARGVGAVMGDKRVKAIAVRGTKDVYVARPTELYEMCATIRKELSQNPNLGEWMATDHDDSFHRDNFARARRSRFWSKEVRENWTRLKYDSSDKQIGCYNCPKKCHNVVTIPGQPRFSYKCYAEGDFRMAAFKELDFSYDILPIVRSYGLDAYSTPQVIDFAFELREAGILRGSDFPEMPFDDVDRLHYLLDKIARREGIGDVLADGVSRAAICIGRGAEKFDHYTVKKLEQPLVKQRKLNSADFLMMATGENLDISQIEGSFPETTLPDPEARERFAQDWEAVPNETLKQHFLNWDKREDLSNEAAYAITEWNEMMHTIDDSLGVCSFLSSSRAQFGGRGGYHIHNLPKILTLATGIKFDEARLWEIGVRNRTLVRALNVRRGMRRIDEKPLSDLITGRDAQSDQQLLSDYYRYRGWNSDGIPTVDTLGKLGLNDVTEDFITREILTGNESVLAKTA